MNTLPNGESSRLGEALAGFAGRRVLVVGDLVADEYIYGETSRVSREAPVLILRHVGRDVIPGGAGNAVLNLQSLGAVPYPVTAIGAGDTADALSDVLAKRGIDVDGLVRDPSRTTCRKTRIMAGGPHGQKQQVIRIDEESRVPLSDDVERRLGEHAFARLDEVDAVLLSDYGYGSIPRAVRTAVIERARRRGIPICADSRYALAEFRGVTYATPNEAEASDAWGQPIERREDLLRAARDLRRDLEAEFLLLTRGKDGMVVAQRDGTFHEVPIWGTAEAADVTGAGDTVAAASLLALVTGASPVDAARLASIAAGIVVKKHGAATTTIEEIQRLARIPEQSPQP